MPKQSRKTEFDSASDALSNYKYPGSSTPRTIYKVNPLGLRIMVKIPEESNQTEGGLYLPESAKDTLSESIVVEVIEVASAHDQQSDEETNVSGIPAGSHVLISKRVGTRVPWDDSLRIVDTKDVLAIVSKIDLS